MAVTDHFQLPLPDEADNVDQEFYRLQLVWAMVDLILFELSQAVANRAAKVHEHPMTDISGLVEALAEKMSADVSFSLDDLDDVEGATDAATNYLLVKGPDGKYRPSSAAAALGSHQHAAGDILGLTEQINAVVANLRDDAPAALDTLKELAAALNNDPNFATSMATLIGQKFDKLGGTISGNLTVLGASVLAGRPTVQGDRIYVGPDGAFMYTNGSPYGPVWEAWGSSSAYSAINARIEARAAAYAADKVTSDTLENRAVAWANDRVSKIAIRRVSKGVITYSSGQPQEKPAPAGAVLTGITYSNNATDLAFHYHFLQLYDPVRGWIGMQG
ncbi:hypothetical protein ABID21_000655 [Pseudorhizobium tarimense]|uniref:Uncharacterized protein n=1 Tax=Pseudorhizobium tarimense TaxID=1079109 RepID=A0ABV2H1Z0_9HYPH|nr:hypothetical protein [Pseudorhizobium tarimense]MCJ8517829.1 hypothetical protein [Pseudorhizobium tarimense]